MSKYKLTRAKTHKVKFDFGKKRQFYTVETTNEKGYYYIKKNNSNYIAVGSLADAIHETEKIFLNSKNEN